MAPATLLSLDCNFLDANRVFMGVSKTGEYLERCHLAIACCGLPVQTLNRGFLEPPYEDLAASAAAVRASRSRRPAPPKRSCRFASLRSAASATRPRRPTSS